MDTTDFEPWRNKRCALNSAPVAGNVVCFVPNGEKAVKLLERWVECRPGRTDQLWSDEKSADFPASGGVATKTLWKQGMSSQLLLEPHWRACLGVMDMGGFLGGRGDLSNSWTFQDASPASPAKTRGSPGREIEIDGAMAAHWANLEAKHGRHQVERSQPQKKRRQASRNQKQLQIQGNSVIKAHQFDIWSRTDANFYLMIVKGPVHLVPRHFNIKQCPMPVYELYFRGEAPRPPCKSRTTEGKGKQEM